MKSNIKISDLIGSVYKYQIGSNALFDIVPGNNTKVWVLECIETMVYHYLFDYEFSSLLSKKEKETYRSVFNSETKKMLSDICIDDILNLFFELRGNDTLYWKLGKDDNRRIISSLFNISKELRGMRSLYEGYLLGLNC